MVSALTAELDAAKAELEGDKKRIAELQVRRGRGEKRDRLRDRETETKRDTDKHRLD